MLLHSYKAPAAIGFPHQHKRTHIKQHTQTQFYGLYLCVQQNPPVWTHLSPEWQPGLRMRCSDGSYWGRVGSSSRSRGPACTAGPAPQSAGSRTGAEPREPCSVRGDRSPATEENKQIVTASSMFNITVPQGFSNVVWSVTHHAPVHSKETPMLLSGLGSVLSRIMWLLSSSKLDFMMIHFVIVLTGPLLLSNVW